MPVRQPPTRRKHEARGFHGTKLHQFDNYWRWGHVSRDKCPWNPLSVDSVESQFSSDAAFEDTTVVKLLAPHVPVDTDAHDQLRQHSGEARRIKDTFRIVVDWIWWA